MSELTENLASFDRKLGIRKHQLCLNQSSAALSYLESHHIKLSVAIDFEWGYWQEQNVLTIPQYTVSGEPIALKVRYLENKGFQYETGFKKSNYLYGFHKAREAAWSCSDVIIVEGEADVLSLHSRGYRNCVALSGTDLNEYRMALILTLSNKICLFLDGDKAGKLATERITNQMKQVFGNSIDIKSVECEGSDPSECSDEQLKELLC